MRYLILLFLLSTFGMKAQGNDKFFTYLKNADINAMEMYLQDKIDFCLFEDVQVLNKQTALTKFKNFTDANRPTGIEMMHSGTSRDKSTNYRVAKLNTANGSFRVFVYSVGALGQNSIKEIRIDKF